MSVDYSDFFNLAKKLIEGTDEIDWRTSASKAYYSAYHLAQTAVDLCPDNQHLAMGSHERLSERFILKNTTPAKSISYMLTSMKRTRRTADYDMDNDFTKSDAIDQLSALAKFTDKVLSFQKAHQHSA